MYLNVTVGNDFHAVSHRLYINIDELPKDFTTTREPLSAAEKSHLESAKIKYFSQRGREAEFVYMGGDCPINFSDSSLTKWILTEAAGYECNSAALKSMHKENEKAMLTSIGTSSSWAGFVTMPYPVSPSR